METKELYTEKPYVITYTNLLEFDGKKLSFRKRELFDLTSTPSLIKRSEQGWWFGKKLLTPSKAKELVKNTTYDVDVTHLQWVDQERLNHVFNL